MYKLIFENEKGESREFIKNRFTLKDNLAASVYNVKQAQYFAKNKENANSEEYKQNQLAFLKMIVEIFDNRFTLEELMQQVDMNQSEVLNKIYLKALGVEESNKEDSDEKKSKERQKK